MTLRNVLPWIHTAYQEGYAIAAFNANTLELMQSIVLAAQAENAPVIIQVSHRALQYVGRGDENCRGSEILGLQYMAAIGKVAANSVEVPVSLHLDHANENEVLQAIALGFTSVMFDGDELSLAENIATTKRLCEIAHSHGICLEAEIGEVPKPNGAKLDPADIDLTDRGYTGHKHNNLGSGADDLGLIYMNARYYVPNTNRFLTPDTIVPDPTNPQQYNRYSYTLNNPLNLIDPSGHCTENYQDDVDLLNQCLEGWNALSNYHSRLAFGIGGSGEFPGEWFNELLRTGSIETMEALMEGYGIDYGYGYDAPTQKSSSGRDPRSRANVAAARNRCRYWQDCYEPVVTAEEMLPDSHVLGGSVSGGVLQGGVGGQELVSNWKSGEQDIFGYAGGGTVIGGKVAGTGYTGFLWNLENNMEYVGPSSSLTVDIALILYFPLTGI